VDRCFGIFFGNLTAPSSRGAAPQQICATLIVVAVQAMMNPDAVSNWSRKPPLVTVKLVESLVGFFAGYRPIFFLLPDDRGVTFS
jgi:hypothetical protein